MIEYMVLASSEGLLSQRQLNKLGEERWKLVVVVRQEGTWYFYLLREKLQS